MPKKAAELDALTVKRLSTPGKHAVGGVDGLYLLVKDTGARSWVLRIVVGKRRQDIGLGGYPDVPLAQAREAARAMREQARAGTDPLAARRAARDALIAAQGRRLTFDEAARRCHAARGAEFRNKKHRAQWINTLTTYASPTIGALPVDAIEASHLVNLLTPIWTTKTETATRLRQRIEAVLDWATVGGYRSGPNPAKWDGSLEHLLPKARKVRKVSHHAALPWQAMGDFMVRLRAAPGIAARALELAILTAGRSGEVRGATWQEFDLDAAIWTIPAARMKAGKPHRVPLSAPAVALLRALPRHRGNPLVFVGPKRGALSENALLAVLRRLGVDATTHGFRSSFKDWCRSATRYPDEVSELALAHVNNDQTRAAYARDELLPARKRLMAEWAAYCAATPRVSGSKVTPLHRVRS